MKKQDINIDNIDKENVFQVPDKYFDDLTLRIQTRVNDEKASRTAWYQIPKIYWSISSSVLAAIVIAVLFWPSAEVAYVDPLADVSDEDIIEYLAYEDVSLDDIAETIEVDDLLLDMEADEMDVSDDLLESELELYEDLDLSIDYI